mmetsp:Transcript_38816/g.110969  ORF Transcript_38816/g.110969 Transcript_38816/m.110969 type:complete len:84 (-) Transcript_38816:158-409(-)
MSVLPLRMCVFVFVYARVPFFKDGGSFVGMYVCMCVLPGHKHMHTNVWVVVVHTCGILLVHESQFEWMDGSSACRAWQLWLID